MELAALRQKLTRLENTQDPVQRDALAKQLLAEFQPVLREARRRAAQEALADGMSRADYARAIGVTRSAVTHLVGD